MNISLQKFLLWKPTRPSFIEALRVFQEIPEEAVELVRLHGNRTKRLRSSSGTPR